MILYLLLCVVTLLAGFGIVAAIGIRISRPHAWMLAPGMCLVFWAVALGIGVSLGIPVRRLALPFWAMTAVAATFGAWRARGTLAREVVGPLVMVTALPIGVMVFDFWHGLANYVGGPAFDGWSYVASAQYLWEMTKGAQGHFAPLYQYATHLNRARFIASGLMGFISPLTGVAGDTQPAAGYFAAWSLFVVGASCASLALANGLRRRWLLLFCALAVASRWAIGALQLHNYDNLIALSFMPMTMGIVTGLPGADWRGSVALGVVLAASVYTYPEMAAFVVLGGALSLARRASTDSRRRPWVAIAAGGSVVAAVLLVPAASDLRWFITNQLTAATAAAGSRAGEGAFPELLKLRDWSATFWGLSSRGAELVTLAGWELVRQSLGLSLWTLAGIGLVRVIRRRLWDIAAIAILLIGGAWFMVAIAQYSYGAYKFVLLGSWSMAWLVVAGAEAVVERSNRPVGSTPLWAFRVAAASTIALIAAGLLGSVAVRIAMFRRSLAVVSIEPYRNVLGMKQVVGTEPVIVAVDDDVANEWAVYFLRHHPISLMWYRGYMALSHVTPLMEQAVPVDVRAIRYVLSDEKPSAHETVWARGPYTLWRIPPAGAVFVKSVLNPNGLERMNGRPFFWIGGGDTEIDLVATSAGEAVLSGRFVRGPSLPSRADRRLSIGSSSGTDQTFTIAQDGVRSLRIPVRAGDNQIHIRSLDQLSATVTGERDTRPLLVGVEGLSVSLRQLPPVQESPAPRALQ